MLAWIKDRADLNDVREKQRDYFTLLFWGDFSGAAGRALAELKEFSTDYPDIPVYILDVGKIKGIHREYGVSTVPTVLAIKDGKTARRIEGAESAAFYGVQLGGAAPAKLARPARKKTRRVTVYTSPGCPACGTVKTYLRRHGIGFREVDISRDQQAAEKIIRRSGQRAVPQTDINGRIVVGFDQDKLDRLLGI